MLVWPGVAATGGARPLSVKTWELETARLLFKRGAGNIKWLDLQQVFEDCFTDKLCSGLGVIYVEPAA